MRNETLLMTPGPTNIPADIKALLAMPTPHHRSQAFATVFQKMRDQLNEIVHNKTGEVVVFASSGTGAMEAAISNFNIKNGSILVVETGYFGIRFKEIGEMYGLKVHTLSFTGAQSADVQAIEKLLKAHPEIQTVYVTHHDTSTGVRNNIEAIGTLLQSFPETLLVIDSISGMVMHEVDMDRWGIDVVIAASQKGFMVPPGLSCVILNQKAIQRSRQATLPRFYFDIPKQIEMLKVNQTFATPAISLIYAMAYATQKILEEGLPAQYTRYQQRRECLEAHLQRSGFELVVKNILDRGNVVVPVFIPKTLTPQKIVDEMEQNHQIMIIGGYGEFKHNTVRIGVLGPITNQDIEDTVSALAQTIKKLLKEENK